MRVSLFLLFVCVCQLMATEIDAQNTEIKISRNNMTLRELIEEIEAQTDYLVVFRNQDVNLDQESGCKFGSTDFFRTKIR